MAAVELILMQRVEKLGQMGEVVKCEAGLRPEFPVAAEEGHPRQQGQPREIPKPSAAQLESRST